MSAVGAFCIWLAVMCPAVAPKRRVTVRGGFIFSGTDFPGRRRIRDCIFGEAVHCRRIQRIVCRGGGRGVRRSEAGWDAGRRRSCVVFPANAGADSRTSNRRTAERDSGSPPEHRNSSGVDRRQSPGRPRHPGPSPAQKERKRSTDFWPRASRGGFGNRPFAANRRDAQRAASRFRRGIIFAASAAAEGNVWDAAIGPRIDIARRANLAALPDGWPATGSNFFISTVGRARGFVSARLRTDVCRESHSRMQTRGVFRHVYKLQAAAFSQFVQPDNLRGRFHTGAQAGQREFDLQRLIFAHRPDAMKGHSTFAQVNREASVFQAQVDVHQRFNLLARRTAAKFLFRGLTGG